MLGAPVLCNTVTLNPVRPHAISHRPAVPRADKIDYARNLEGVEKSWSFRLDRGRLAGSVGDLVSRSGWGSVELWRSPSRSGVSSA